MQWLGLKHSIFREAYTAAHTFEQKVGELVSQEGPATQGAGANDGVGRQHRLHILGVGEGLAPTGAGSSAPSTEAGATMLDKKFQKIQNPFTHFWGFSSSEGSWPNPQGGRLADGYPHPPRATALLKKKSNLWPAASPAAGAGDRSASPARHVGRAVLWPDQGGGGVLKKMQCQPRGGRGWIRRGGLGSGSLRAARESLGVDPPGGGRWETLLARPPCTVPISIKPRQAFPSSRNSLHRGEK